MEEKKQAAKEIINILKDKYHFSPADGMDVIAGILQAMMMANALFSEANSKKIVN